MSDYKKPDKFEYYSSIIFLSIIGGVGVLGIVMAFVLWGYQMLVWFKSGVWVDLVTLQYIPLDGLYNFFNEWVGIQKIILWVGKLNLTTFCLASGILVALIGFFGVKEKKDRGFSES